MTLSRHALRALSLSATFLGLMAFGTSAAQAADWDVGGVKLVNTLKVELGAKVETHLLLKTQVGIIFVEILCKKVTPKFLLKEGGKGLGTLLFEECSTFLNKSGTASAACLPKTGGVKDHITTNLIEGELVLHTPAGGSAEDLFKLTPEDAEGKLIATFVKIEFEPSCALGASADVTGSFFLKDCKNLILTAAVTHLVVEGPLTDLKFAGQKATIEGSAELFLTEAHLNKTWNALNV